MGERKEETGMIRTTKDTEREKRDPVKNEHWAGHGEKRGGKDKKTGHHFGKKDLTGDIEYI